LNTKKKIIKGWGAWLTVGLLLALLVGTAVFFVSRVSQLTAASNKAMKRPVGSHKSHHLADQALFGKYDKAAQPQKAKTGLTVAGLIADPADPQSKSAMALLKSERGESKIYRNGSALPGGYTVTGITAKQLMIKSAQGRLFYLNLLKPSLAG
jgi:hypothetical protein